VVGFLAKVVAVMLIPMITLCKKCLEMISQVIKLMSPMLN